MSNNPTLIAGFEDFLNYIKNQDETIKTLKKQAQEHKEADEQIQKLTKELVALKDAEIAKLKEQNEKMTLYLETREIKYCEKCGLYGDEGDEIKRNDDYSYYCEDCNEEEVEVDKYDGDDWGWVYGKMCVDTDEEYKEVVLCMAGGGDHWENYIMTPTMNYIENKDGRHPQNDKVLVQSSCGKYVSFQDKDYEFEGDETDCQYHHCVE